MSHHVAKVLSGAHCVGGAFQLHAVIVLVPSVVSFSPIQSPVILVDGAIVVCELCVLLHKFVGVLDVLPEVA